MALRIAVVGGGTGYIGRHVCRALEYNGYEVKNVTRKARYKDDLTWQDIERLGLPVGTHAVFNFAGEPVLNHHKRWKRSLEQEIYESRVYTTSLLRDLIVDSMDRPHFWGSCSAVQYYPPNRFKNTNYDEYTRVDAKERDYWSKLCKKWEEAAELPSYLENEVRHVSLRVGTVLGPGGGALGRMHRKYSMGMGGPIGNGQQLYPWIHIDDLVELWFYALRMRDMHGVYNAVSPQKITNGQFAKTLGEALGRPATLRIPAFSVKMMYGDVRAALLLQGQHVSPKRAIDSGFLFKYSDIRHALNDSLKFNHF